MKAEKLALFQIVCYFVIKYISGCCLKLNSTLDYNRVEYTFCSYSKLLICCCDLYPLLNTPIPIPKFK